MWESATPEWPPTTGLAKRFTDPVFAMAFARLVTQYVRNDAFLEDGASFATPTFWPASRDLGERTLRSAGAPRQCLGSRPRVATRRAHDRRRRGPRHGRPGRHPSADRRHRSIRRALAGRSGLAAVRCETVISSRSRR